MRLLELTNKRTKKAFHNFPKKLYKNDPNWICPLDIEIEGIFNPKTNSKFENGEAIRWILFDDSEIVIGRIAAFYDNHLVNHYRYPTGGCGFFECVDDQEAANMLFDAAKAWLSEKGMQAMQGPINFGENYNYWGLLVDGFMKQSYALPYNFPYYESLFENYGFQNYFEQYSYHNPVHKWPERMLRFADYISKRPNYTFESLSYNRLDEFVAYFVEIYNDIWSTFHKNYTPLEDDSIRKMLLDAKPIIDEELVWFAFDEGKPIGFLGVTPDVNQVLAKLKNGKLNLINKLKFVYYKKRAVTRSRVFVGGVHPEYQNTGIAGAMFLQLINKLKAKKNQQEIEMGWIGDYNKKMQSVYETIGVKRAKTHITYLKLFDDSLKFERFTNEFEGKLYNK